MTKEIDISKGFDLGCFHYEVLSDEATIRDLHDRQRFGECSTAQHLIRVSTLFQPDQYHNTFLHEAIEAINEIYCNGKLKHDEITNLANGLAQTTKSLGMIFVKGK